MKSLCSLQIVLANFAFLSTTDRYEIFHISLNLLMLLGTCYDTSELDIL